MSVFFNITNRKSRREKITILRDIVDGNIYPYFKTRFINETSSAYPLTDESWKKMFISLNHMSKILYEYLNFIPQLDTIINAKEKQIKHLKYWLNDIDWEDIQMELMKLQEMTDSQFIYWYFEEGKKNPRLKILKSENITDIIKDENENITDYVYEEVVTSSKVDKLTGYKSEIKTETVKWIFSRGSVTKIKGGKSTTIPNRVEFANDFQLYQMITDKTNGDDYGTISLERVIDDCLLLDKIDTNWDLINTLAGFPKVFLNNCMIDIDNSSGSAGGVITVKPIEHGIASSITQLEITNALESLQRQRDIVMKNLYKNYNLIREDLEEKLSSSDSSRIVSQLRLPLELKIKKRIRKVNEFMTFMFDVVLKSNKMNNKDGATFKIPEPVIENSIFDKLLIDTQKLALGQTTIQQILREKGFTQEQINMIIEEINEEKLNGLQDISIKETPNEISDEATGLDNNFK